MRVLTLRHALRQVAPRQWGVVTQWWVTQVAVNRVVFSRLAFLALHVRIRDDTCTPGLLSNVLGMRCWTRVRA